MFCWDQTPEFPTRISYLKLVLLAPEVGPLLLPEVVGFDDVSGVHGVTEVVLQHLQDGLDRAPAGVSPHVYHHAVAEFPHVLAEILELLNILTELHSCFVFISGSFKSLPTSVISSLIQLNVQAVFNSGRRGPDQRNSAMSGIEFQENSFAKFFRLGKSQGQLFTFIEGFR